MDPVLIRDTDTYRFSSSQGPVINFSVFRLPVTHVVAITAACCAVKGRDA